MFKDQYQFQIRTDVERARPEAQIKPENLIRHLANLSILHGVFYKGTYYHHGIAQQTKPKNEIPKKQIQGSAQIPHIRK